MTGVGLDAGAVLAVAVGFVCRGAVLKQIEGSAMDDKETLPWARPLRDRRCQARREKRPGDGAHQHFGRCELVAGHDGDHALERGFETPRWSTDWTAAA